MARNISKLKHTDHMDEINGLLVNGTTLHSRNQHVDVYLEMSIRYGKEEPSMHGEL